jgi:hypothetical protein
MTPFPVSPLLLSVCAGTAHELCHLIRNPAAKASAALVNGVMPDREVNRRSGAEPFVSAPVLDVRLDPILIASAWRPFR